MDPLLLNDLSPFVEWEQDLQWLPVPADESRARAMGVPDRWAHVLTSPDPVGQQVASLWSGLRPVLPRTCKVLAEQTHGLALLRTREHGASLVYLFISGGELVARRGFAPSAALPAIAARFPIDLSPLYQLHDGFVHLASYDGGPLPIAQWKTLVDPETREPSLVKIAVDGADAFGFDISEFPCRAYALSPDDDDVAEIEAPWTFIDDLLASRLEDL